MFNTYKAGQAEMLASIVKTISQDQVREEREQQIFIWRLIAWLATIAIPIYVTISLIEGNWFKWFVEEFFNG
jgi:fatty acid desaturase